MGRKVIRRVAAFVSPVLVGPALYLLLLVISTGGMPSSPLGIWIYAFPFIVLAELAVLVFSIPMLPRVLSSSKSALIYGALAGLSASIGILVLLSLLVGISALFAVGMLVIGMLTGLVSGAIYAP